MVTSPLDFWIEYTLFGKFVQCRVHEEISYTDKTQSETINGDDIVKSEPLRIVLQGDGTFIDIKVLHCNNPSNIFKTKISDDKKAIALTFDYLDKNDGIVLQILHTNISSDAIELVGRIKGAGTPKKRARTTTMPSVWAYMASLILPLFCLSTIALFFLVLTFRDIVIIDRLLESKIFLIVAGLWILASLYLPIIFTIKFFKSRLPKGYSVFLKDEL